MEAKAGMLTEGHETIKMCSNCEHSGANADNLKLLECRLNPPVMAIIPMTDPMGRITGSTKISAYPLCVKQPCSQWTEKKASAFDADQINIFPTLD